MADYQIPPDLLNAQVAFYMADAECERLAAALPPSTAGGASISDEQRDELDKARARRMDLVNILYDDTHPWWSEVDNRYFARMALYKAAKTKLAAKAGKASS
ncbi:hypothetical protein GCM10010156_66350 [Planobispora rosea]|uniref:Uncharacterized protein n=1 Tax=Planobispora rosea TaxID=35762 RepID=A0A8J3SAA9_PLARO|nr:hypothetical protein [Planobispora rosea]GGS98950.1 hypothetical protein GCM10010156_66350 [Planobispora rosea]GIH87999.1 hypothetical protein Pro02_64070 [Planobispora rosea]